MNHNQIIEAWNAQSDVQNQWYVLGEDEKVEFAFSLGAGNLDRANALLRQALEALAKYTTLGVLGGRVPIDAELVAAIKQHLGEV